MPKCDGGKHGLEATLSPDDTWYCHKCGKGKGGVSPHTLPPNACPHLHLRLATAPQCVFVCVFVCVCVCVCVVRMHGLAKAARLTA